MLAYGIGVSKGFIGMAESPKYNIKYNVNHINEIAKYLGCSPRDFLPENPSNPLPSPPRCCDE